MSAANSSSLVQRCKAHWMLLVVLSVAVVLIFADLGREYLWADEGDTAVFGRTILKTGLPYGWDGVTFTDSDMGERLNEDLLLIGHPWVQYYVAAGSFFIFGETPFAARFPFAMAGWLTIPLLYYLVFRLTHDRRAALLGAILLILSVQFLLYARQSRNYSLNMFFTCLLLLGFFRLTTWRGAAVFVVVALLSFHSHPIALATFAGLGVLTLFYKPFFIFRKWFWFSMIPVSLLTVPWLLMARSGLQENTTPLTDITRLIPRLLQATIECASVAPVVGIMVMLSFLAFRARGGTKRKQGAVSGWSEGEKNFVVLILMIIASGLALMGATQGMHEMWSVGMRYAAHLLPLVFGLAGFLIAKLSAGRTFLCVILVLIFGFTKAGELTPYTFGKQKVMYEDSDFVGVHVAPTFAARLLRPEQIGFLKELTQSNPGSIARICQFLKDNAAPEDILITNYEWEPIYFHNQLPQGLKVSPEASIYQAAVKHGLPDYVFSVDQARWVIWRSPWQDYRGYSLQPILEEILRQGGTIEKAASFKETVWENRENLHFCRFPGDVYTFPWFENLGDVQVFRVSWPNKPEKKMVPEEGIEPPTKGL